MFASSASSPTRPATARLTTLAAIGAMIETAQPRRDLSMLGSAGSAGTLVHVEKGAEIVAQGDAADHCFEVVEGCVRSVQRLEDGRRHVGEFLLPGDIFGLEAVGEHELAAEAVTCCTIRRLRLTTVELLAEEDAGFALRLRRHLTRQAKSMRRRLLLLGRMTAAERVAAFLLEMSERLQDTPLGTVDLPMNRGDMADYLGLTIETVSRCLSDLKRGGIIAVKGAQITIRNRHRLGLETLH
ncbi:helix-turn-helix domain-containing protein [Acidisoma sp. 7E03]